MVSQVLQHGHRFVIRPVHILQHKDGTTFGRQPAQNPQHRLGTHNRRGRHRRKARTRCPVRHQDPQRGKIRCQDRVIRTAAVTQAVQQRLAKRPQRRDPICWRRTADQGHLPPSAGPIGRLGDQPGLANARLACHDDAGTATASRPAEDLRQYGQFHIPADKDGTPHARNYRTHPCSEGIRGPWPPANKRHQPPSRTHHAVSKALRIRSFCAARPQGTRHRQAVRNRRYGTRRPAF